MSFARITYTPEGFTLVNYDFPEELSAWNGPLRNAERQTNETEGGVFMVHFEHFEDECVAVIEKMPFSESFHNKTVAFWTHASRGGRFTFARDASQSANSLVRTATAAGDVVVPVDLSGVFTIGERVAIESATDGWQQEAALLSAASYAPPHTVTATNPLIFGWSIGDVVRSEFYFPDCMLIDDQWPITEEANGLQMTLRLRFKTFAGRAIAQEPA